MFTSLMIIMIVIPWLIFHKLREKISFSIDIVVFIYDFLFEIMKMKIGLIYNLSRRYVERQ